MAFDRGTKSPLVKRDRQTDRFKFQSKRIW